VFNLKKIKNKKDKPGTTLIEALTFLFIFSVVTIAFYSAWTVATNYILLAKAQLVASALANEKLEIIRNLAFEDIIHDGMDPVNAILLEDEYLNRGGRAFHIHTWIDNQDDPFDGECISTGDPDCPAPVDYKDVKIEVSWDNEKHKIFSSSRFVPAGMELPDPTKGILVVNVLSDKDSMNPVSGANIFLERIDISYSDNQTTDATGRKVISGLSEAIQKYKVTLTKSGYETIATELPFIDGGSYNPPVYEHASVVALSVNTLDLYQNKLSDLDVKTEDYIGNSVSDFNYHIKGGRELGEVGGETVYTLNSDDQTNSSGEKDYDDISPGKIYFTPTEANYKIISASRSLNFDLIPGEEALFTIKVSPENVTALLFIVGDNSGGSVVSNATIHLTSVGGYDAMVSTDSNGLAFFPKEEIAPLIVGEVCDYSINASNFDEVTGQVMIEGGVLKEESVMLTPSD
jgi:hypothetical protein